MQLRKVRFIILVAIGCLLAVDHLLILHHCIFPTNYDFPGSKFNTAKAKAAESGQDRQTAFPILAKSDSYGPEPKDWQAIDNFHRLGRIFEIKDPNGSGFESTSYYSADHVMVDAGSLEKASKILSRLNSSGFEAKQPYSFSPIIYVNFFAETPDDLRLFKQMVDDALDHEYTPTIDEVRKIAKCSLPEIIPNETTFERWHLKKIHCREAWAISQGSPSVTVAVLDTGISNWSGDFDGRIKPGYNFADDNNNVEDLDGHGTAVASVLAATGNNAKYEVGIDWNCTIVPIKVLDERNLQFDSKLAAAIDFSTANGAHVVTMSFLLNPSDSVVGAIQRALNANIVIVVGAGNSGYEQVNTMGVYPGVITVGGSNEEDQREGSNWGRDLDILAPSQNIRAITLGETKPLWGTSFAAPQVAGTASLILSLRPNLTPAEVEAILYSGADDLGNPGWDPETGWGRLNVLNSLKLARLQMDLTMDKGGIRQLLWETPSSSVSRATPSLMESKDLLKWRRVETGIFETMEYWTRWTKNGRLNEVDPGFFRVEAVHRPDYSPRVTRKYPSGDPIAFAAALVHEIPPFEPNDAAVSAFEIALADAKKNELPTVPGYYRCKLESRLFPYLIRYHLGEQRWQVSESGLRLQQLAKALTLWGTVDQITDTGHVIERDSREVSPTYEEWDALLQEQIGSHYLFIPHCEGLRDRPFTDVPFAIFYPSAGELVTIDEETNSFIARLPHDLQVWLLGCSMLESIEPVGVE